MIYRKTQWKLLVPAVVASLQLGLPALASSYARDMFYQELKQPTSAPNALSGAHPQHAQHSQPSQSAQPQGSSHAGLSYWIELKRGGKTTKVDSRVKFHGGDKIKFHITPSIDGFAHIILLQGSSGAQKVLFPDPTKDPTNQVHRGHDYAIPAVTYLEFDNTPGREHVRIALTRQNQDATKLMQPQAASQLAMATISPNQAIDPTAGREQIKVSFKEDIPKPVPIVRPAQGTPPSQVSHAAPVHEAPVAAPTNDTPIANAIPDEDSSKDMFRDDAGSPGRVSSGGSHHAVHHSSYHPSHASRPAYHPHYAASTYRPASTYTPPPEPPSTVVLNTNANEDLYADISLEHD